MKHPFDMTACSLYFYNHIDLSEDKVLCFDTKRFFK